MRYECRIISIFTLLYSQHSREKISIIMLRF